MNPIIIYSVLLVIMSSILQASGQELITDRPDQTESSSTVPKGSLQIESGVFLEFTESAAISERQFIGPSSLFRAGITRGIELRVVNQYLNIRDKTNSVEISGIGDLELGIKIQLLKKEHVNTEIAVLSHIILPVGSEDLSNDMTGTINKIAVSHDWFENIEIGYNFGYNYIESGNGDLTYSLVFGFGINEKAGIYIEPFGEIQNTKEHLAAFNAGIAYLVHENFQLDFSFGLGINYTMNYMACGFSWNIRNKKEN